MDDVMSSLDDMTVARRESDHDDEPLNPWSPEAFDNFRQPQRPPVHDH